MCGINGLINIGNESVLLKMNKVLSHRGPDDAGTAWIHEFNSGLGHQRLSIIDLSEKGHQPMYNDDKTLCITYNGEIYNYSIIRKELLAKGHTFFSNSDTEVILKGYQEWGSSILTKLNGMFSFAILDTKRNHLFAARDRLGIKPFYYSQQSNSLIFSSEIKSLLSSGLIEKSLDYQAFITPTRYQISPLTGFKNIYKLPPGCALKFDNGNLTIKHYWNIEPTETGTDKNQAIETLDYLLNDSVGLQMVSDVPVGVFLSGGLDSSLIAALMVKHSSSQLHSFTIKISDKDNELERSTDDSFYARKVANQFNFNHHEIEVSPNIVELLPKMVYHLDEPLTDPASINNYLISKSARENGIIVLLNGMGGDEVFGGYRKQLACHLVNYYKNFIPYPLRTGLFNLIEKTKIASNGKGNRRTRWLKRFLSFVELNEFERFIASDLSMSRKQFQNLFITDILYNDTFFYQSRKSHFTSSNLSYITKMCLDDTKTFLPEHNLTYSDKSSMAASVETRPPLIDHRIVEFMYTLPPYFRINGLTQKYLLKNVAEKYLPKEIIYRPKASFGVPLRAWIKNDLQEMVGDLLNETSIRKRGLFNATAITNAIDTDRNGYEDNSLLIWQMLTLEIWFNTFFDNK